MKSVEIKVTSNGFGMEDALALTEKTALDAGLEKKELLRMRLLTEELIGMMRGIAGDVEAFFSIDSEAGKKFALQLSADIKMKRELYDQLIALSTSGKNAAAKGFMGKLREMIAVALLPDKTGFSVMQGFSLGMMGASASSLPNAQMIGAESFEWSLSQYKDDISNSSDAKSAWDELERSIVASIADEVKVSVVGSHAGITIYKAF